MKHDWVRAVLYRTTQRDIEDGVMFLADPTRIGLGDPGCYVCGADYEGAPAECPGEKKPANGEPAAADAFEPLIKQTPKARPARKSVI